MKKVRKNWYIIILVLITPVLVFWLVRTLVQKENEAKESQKDFSRGVLVINTNQSVYAKNEPVEFGIASLDPKGNTLCHSNLKLTIKGPTGLETELSTQNNQITASATCSEENNVTNDPDYRAFFTAVQEGTYKVILTNNDNNYQVENQFKVEAKVKYNLTRSGAVRLNPFKSGRYPMTLTLLANQDFKGQIVEQIPAAFGVVWQGPAKVETAGKYHTISWEVDLKAGESKEVIYEYAPPKISPNFYILGKARLTAQNGAKVFEEFRFWQLASDADVTLSGTLYQSDESTAYQCATNRPSYTAGTYSVSDDLTGLVWQRYGHGSSNGYTVPTQTSDCASGGTYSSSYCTYSWQDALKYCSSLSLDSQTDWRLPNAREFTSIVKYGVAAPVIDTSSFLNTSSTYWSSSTSMSTQTSAFYVNFSTGSVPNISKSNSYRVRCVRGSAGVALQDTGDTNCYDGTTTHACSYADYPDQDGDYTINAPSYTAGTYSTTDNNTGLIWQKHGHGSSDGYTVPSAVGNCASGGTYSSSYCTYSWQDALKYCSNLSLDSQTDWRLPNIKELQSIVKYGASSPSIDTTNFLNTKSDYYYSSSTRFADPTNNWSVFFSSSGIAYTTKTTSYYVRCVRGTSASLPDTGQTTCYKSICGISCGGSDNPDQDGDYTINAPSYTAGTYSTTDNNTGLIWQRYGHGSSDGYTVPSAVDNCASGGTYSSSECTYSWQDALKYCSNLSLDSQTDWRLPNAKELQSIVKYGASSPSIDTSSFLNTASSIYWSSSTSSSNPYYAWYVGFNAGNVWGGTTKSTSYRVRCVRGSAGVALQDTGDTNCYDGTTTHACSYADYPDQDGDYTINAPSYTAGTYSTTDNNTGLIWQKHGHGSSDGYTVPSAVGNCASGGTYSSSYCTYSWQDALKYCSNLSMDGQTDWRLPNAKELQSIVKYGASSPSIDTSSFLNTASDNYWSSSTYFYTQLNAWVVSSVDGNLNQISKSPIVYVRCVRGSAGTALPDTDQTACYDSTIVIACSGSDHPDQDAYYTSGGTNIKVVVNNSSTYAAACTADTGAWQTASTIPVTSGNTVAVYVYGRTYKGSTFLITDATTKSDVHLLQNRLTIRDDNNASATNSEILTGNTSDTDDLITTSGTDVTVGSGYETHVYTGDAYAPGANVSTDKLHLVGSYTGSSETLTLAGSGTTTSRPLYVNGGTFTAPATTTFTGSSATDIEATTFNALNFTPSISGATAYTCLGAETINGDFTVNPSGSNTLTVSLGGTTTIASANTTYVQAGGSAASILDTVSSYGLSSGFLNIGGGGTLDANSSTITLTGTSSPVFTRTGTFDVSGGTSTVNFSQTSANTAIISGQITFDNLQLNMAGKTGTLGAAATVNNDLTVTAGTLDTGTNYTVTTGGVSIGASGILKANNSAINVSGNWSNTGGFTQGASTVSFTPTQLTYATRDSVTGLTWQKYGHGSSDGYTVPTGVGNCASGATYSSSYCTYNWQDALKYCSNLSMDGQTDWRLPNAKELQSIVKYGASSPAIDTANFLYTSSATYWSSSSQSGTISWYVKFDYGSIDGVTKSSSTYVRCVRGSAGTALPDTGNTSCYDGTTTHACSYSEYPDQDGDYTINAPSYTAGTYSTTDNNTGLIWQRYGHGSSDGYTVPSSVGNCASGGTYSSSYCTYSWQDALKYCSNLSLDSQTDWRLPNARELLSIVKYGASSPSIDTSSFLNTASDRHWSSSTYYSNSSNALRVGFNGGYFNNTSKTTSYYVRCVRGSTGLTLPDTGQTACYDGTTTHDCSYADYPDQDGDYTINAPSYAAAYKGDFQVSGNTTFYNLSATQNMQAITFAHDSITGIANSGSLSLSGALGSLLTLQSDTTADWHLHVSNTGTTVSVAYVKPSHSDASGYRWIDARDGTSTDGLNNIHWLFPGDSPLLINNDTGSKFNFNGVKLNNLNID